MTLTPKDKTALKAGGLALLVFFLIACFALFLRFRSARDPENKFTPEQRAVLSALRNARADLENAQTKVEQSKRELADMMASARQNAIAKGIDPNVHTSWLNLSANNQPLVTCPNAQTQNVSIHWGFRDDGLIVWKRP